MAVLHLRLHGDLTDFTRPITGERVAQPAPVVLSAPFEGRPALKDLLESVGVPHCEVDLAVVDEVSTSLEAPAQDGVTVDIFPAREGPAEGRRLLPELHAEPRFVLDGHLGRLAELLRMLGFDVLCERDPEDAALAETSAREDRTLLTRDLGLLKRSLVKRGAFVRATDPLKQGREVAARFLLASKARPFSRCTRCNTPLRAISAEDAAPRVPPRVRELQQHFLACDGCGRVYWPGTHHEQMRALVASLLEPA
jgi:uncharacterized protein with PIN domain